MDKPNRGLGVVCFAVMVGLAAAPLLAASEWTLVHVSERLTVERRDYKGSDLDEIRGVLRLDASLNAVMALLKDASFNEHWVSRSGGARVLKEMGYPQAYVYGIVDAPFPMVDRDTVVRFDFQQDPVTREITIGITNFPQFAPEADGLVRVPDFGGFWALDLAQSADRTRGATEFISAPLAGFSSERPLYHRYPPALYAG